MDYRCGAARHGWTSRMQSQPLAFIGPGIAILAFLSGCQAAPPPTDPVHSAQILGLDSGAVRPGERLLLFSYGYGAHWTALAVEA